MATLWEKSCHYEEGGETNSRFLLRHEADKEESLWSRPMTLLHTGCSKIGCLLHYSSWHRNYVSLPLSLSCQQCGPWGLVPKFLGIKCKRICASSS